MGKMFITDEIPDGMEKTHKSAGLSHDEETNTVVVTGDLGDHEIDVSDDFDLKEDVCDVYEEVVERNTK